MAVVGLGAMGMVHVVPASMHARSGDPALAPVPPFAGHATGRLAFRPAGSGL